MDDDEVIESLVRVDSSGDVVHITLNRPRRHNALVPTLLREFRAALAQAATARAVTLQGSGPNFSTGGDVKAFADQAPETLGDYATEVVGELNAAILALIDLPVPVVAAAHGVTTGGSLGLLLASDVVIAAPDSSFAPYYAQVGFSPDGGWTALLPDRIGFGRARSWLLCNNTIDGATAAAWGLADELVPDPAAAAASRAARIAELQPGALRRTKELCRPDRDRLAGRLEAELEQFVVQIDSPEARSGMARFLGR